jgi:thioredoxin reductase (NADPH)
MNYDLIVIGMGPAGISAALYAKRSNLKVLILEKKMPGGLLNYINKIENYPGYISVSGPELAYNFLNNIKENDIPYKLEEVKEIKVVNNTKIVITNKSEYSTSNVILSTGRKQRMLELAHEKELLGKGISTCAICDGMFYKNLDVAVVGGGNSAFQESLYLANIAKSVTLINRSDKYKANSSLIKLVEENDKINILNNSKVTKLISEDEHLKAIEVNNKKIIEVQGLFIYIGYEPINNIIIKNIETDEYGYIKINYNYETNISGIYAIGSTINIELNQILTVCAQGAACAMNIVRKIKNSKE